MVHKLVELNVALNDATTLVIGRVIIDVYFKHQLIIAVGLDGIDHMRALC